MIIPKGVNTWGKITKPILFPIFEKLPFPKFKADIFFVDKEIPLYEYGIEGKIIHTPGHTPGSLSVLLDTGEAFVGCMAHNNLPFRLRPGLPVFAQHIDSIMANWKFLIDRGAKMVYPGHGKPFPIEVMKKILN